MTTFSTLTQFIGLIVWLAISYAAAAIGAVASIRAASFYAQLAQPEWAPPAWLFGPVWMVLYGLMGIAAWLVWRMHGFYEARAALILFLVQLVLNALWSWLFFGWRLGAVAFVDIVVLWGLILVTLVLFWRAQWIAGALLAPYLLWVTFAAALNFTVWRMNPQILG